MLRRYFGIGAREDSDNIRNQVVKRVLELDNTLKDTIPPILSLLGATPDDSTTQVALQRDFGEMISRFNSMDPPQRRRYTLDALKRICIRESQRQDLLLVFEDLHWIDNETQAFLDGLVESLPMVRVMLLVNYRREYNHSWSDKSYYTQVRVDPLEVSSAEELLSKLLGNNPDLSPLKQLLVKRTEGNPFFAEESVRSLVETGVLVGEKGAYRPGLKMDDLAVPSTVQIVVADRIDRLPAEEKHLLQTAAVIGVIVPFDLLQEVSELPTEQLFQSLAHLNSAEFIFESNLFPKLEYKFKHALTNEVAYGELLQERRTALHARIVSALEAMTGTPFHDHLVMLAHHAFSGELWDKAVGYLKEAGDMAVSRSSFRNAVLHYERALQALRHLPESPDNLRRGIDLRFDIRNALFLLNDIKRGFEYLEEAKETARALNDHERLGKLFTWMTAYWNLMGKSEQAVVAGQQALEHTVGPKNIESNIVAHYFLGVAYHNLGEFQRSIGELETARSLVTTEDRKYDRLGTTGIVSVLCNAWLIRGLAQIGNFSATSQHGEQAVQTALERDHPFSTVYAYYAVGTVALIKGDFDRAVAALERALSVCEAAEIPVLRPLVVSCLRAAYASVGSFEDALRLLESTKDRDEWITGAGSQQLPFGKVMRMVWEVEAYKLAGQYSEAMALALRVLEVSRDSKDKGSEAWLLRQLGDLLARIHPAHSMQAAASYTEGLKLAQDLGMRPLQAHCHLGLGQIHAQAENGSVARSELHAASELYRAMSMSFWVAKADLALSDVGSL
jgi:tetratricopeptide (TPR) repeat protein